MSKSFIFLCIGVIVFLIGLLSFSFEAEAGVLYGDDWPDAIICNISNPAVGTTTLWHSYLKSAGGNNHHYQSFYNHDASTEYQVEYNLDGTYDSDVGITTADCLVAISSIPSAQKIDFGSDSGFSGETATTTLSLSTDPVQNVLLAGILLIFSAMYVRRVFFS